MARPTISNPVRNPIPIDVETIYFYVIPHTGGTAAAVTPNGDFDLIMQFGAKAATLTLRYTGAVGAAPTLHDVVVSVSNADGATSQTLTFKIGTYTSRKIANITNGANGTAAPGVAIGVPISTDVDALIGGVRVSAIGLPAGLSVNPTTHYIVGDAPSTPGDYVITLTATAGVNDIYSRYWVLTVAEAVGSGTINVPPPSGVGIHVLYDGDYTVAQQAGSPIPVNPLPEDPKPYIYRIKFWQFLSSYEQLEPGSVGPNGGYYVGEVPGSFQDVGAGVVEFVREFALVPDSRNEFESFTYSYQFIFAGEIIEVPSVTLSRVQYDYFHLNSVPDALASTKAPENMGGGAARVTNAGGWGGTAPGSTGGSSWIAGSNAGGSITEIHLPKAPKVIKIGPGLYGLNGWGTLVAGEEILAEDATIKQWRGLIFERKQRFVVIFGTGDALG
jgi:Putative Ig domain